MSLSVSTYQVTPDHARRCAEYFCAPGKSIGKGDPWYSVKCPIHEDESGTSLGVGWFAGKDGRGMVKFKCHAGCDWKSIDGLAVSLGLIPKWQPEKKTVEPSYDALYAYRDESGVTLYQKLRSKDANGKKKFSQRQPKDGGGWFYHLSGTRKVPYNLPEVMKTAKEGGTILLMEGEKDCDNATKDGFVASTNFDGGDKWKDELTGYFRGAKVILIPDNDWIGYQHLNKVGKSFQKQGMTLYWIELPGAGHKEDYTDWRENCDLEQFKDLLNDVQAWSGDVPNPWPAPQSPTKSAEIFSGDNVVTMRPRTQWTQRSNIAEIYKDNPIIRNVEGLTENGNGLRLIAAHGEDIRCCIERGWVIWDGKRFLFDAEPHVRQLCKGVARKILLETDVFQAADLIKHVTSTLKVRGISNMMASAQSEPEVRCHIYDFDADPYVLNTQDGIVLLKTGELIEHNRSYMCTQIAACGFDSKFYDELVESQFADRTEFNALLWENIPEWMDIMAWICKEDWQLFDYLHKLCGYCLTGDTSLQQGYFIFGDGQNLKSTFIDNLAFMMGSYAKTVRSEMFMRRHGPESQQDNFSQLVNIRLAAVQEIDSDDSLDEAKFKVFTGKTDRITARFLTKEPFDYINKAKALFRANHLPRIKNFDKGIWRRIKKIPFANTIPDNQVKANNDDALKAEWSKLCALYVFYLGKLLREQRLAEPQVVVDETKAYEAEMDSFSVFIAEALKGDAKPTDTETVKDLMYAYKKVAELYGFAPMGHIKFGCALKRKGYEKTGDLGSERSPSYKGLCLKEEYRRGYDKR